MRQRLIHQCKNCNAIRPIVVRADDTVKAIKNEVDIISLPKILPHIPNARSGDYMSGATMSRDRCVTWIYARQNGSFD